jgi:hypothetical protein
MQGDPCEVDCDGCRIPVKSHFLKDNYCPTLSDCEFCRNEKTCSGHLIWKDGELDQWGRTKLESVPCSNTATIYCTESQDFHCEQCWNKLHDKEDLREMEELVVRVPDD